MAAAELARACCPCKSGVSVCPKCGAILVGHEPDWARRQEPASEPQPDVSRDSHAEWLQLVSVATIHSTALIPLVKSLLDGAGIRYFIKNERTHDLLGYPRFSTGGYNSWWQPEVMVEPGKAEEARALLRDLEHVNGNA